MGAFSKKADITIPASPEEGNAWGWEAHEKIQIKGRLSTADLDKITAGEKQDRQISTIVQVLVRDWTMIDEETGLKMEVSDTNKAELPPTYSLRVVAAATEILNGGMTKEEAESFLTAATARSQGS